MRQLATIQKIAEIQPIEGADAIEKVRINEWWCVAKKAEFKQGDYCVYFEIDSLLPVTNAYFSFLEKGNKPKKMLVEGKEYIGYRLKTIRLRGQISQGLALPVSILPSSFTFVPDGQLGMDVSDILEVVKYEPPMPAELAGKVKGNFPQFIPKTDEERVQNIPLIIQNHFGEKFFITEKLDGTSCTFYKKDGVFGVCSRNLDLLENEGNTHWKMARSLNLPDRITDGFAIQGEIVGDGIQQNPLKISGHAFYAYNVYNIAEKKYLDFTDFVKFCASLQIETVPIIDLDFKLDKSVPELLIMADGKSVLNAESKREGIVIRPFFETMERIRGVDNARLSFKVISNDYLLGEK